jgi:diguanylate cyclase (GGDEF)-like protein
MHLLRSLLLLTVPAALFGAALYLQLAVAVPAAWQPLLQLFPYLAEGSALFLGWRFNRTRVLFAVILLVLVERLLGLTSSSGREFLLQVLPVVLPLNLALLAWWSERGLFTVHGALRLAILVGQGGGVVWLYRACGDEVIAWLGYPLLGSSWLSSLGLSQIALLVLLLSTLLLLARFLIKQEALEGSFCWLPAALAVGLWWPDSFAYWGGVGAFMLTVAIIEGSFKMAFNDELTGLPARRALNEFLLKVGRRYTVAVVDVDHFKKVNDNHGHDVGDQVLRMVATSLRRVTGGGRAYRYGGEEFVIVFPGKDLERALPHLEQLREAISGNSFVVRGRKRPKQKPQGPKQPRSGKTAKASLNVTVSIGVASRDDRHSTSEQLIKAADKALYKAKQGGRNRVCS